VNCIMFLCYSGK